MNMAYWVVPGCRSVSDDEIRHAAARIVDEGYAEIENYFDDDDVAEARSQVIDAVCLGTGADIGSDGLEGFCGTILSRYSASEELHRLCAELCRYQGHRVPQGVVTKQVLRCLFGKSGSRQAYYFHYDSFLLTVLVPIAIPQEGPTGDLLMFPNARRARSSYLVNAAEKFLLDRWPAQRVLRRTALRSDRVLRLKLTPGSIYVFAGDRTLHANEPCDPRSLRATMLLHYSETHQDHWLKRARRARNRRRSSSPDRSETGARKPERSATDQESVQV